MDMVELMNYGVQKYEIHQKMVPSQMLAWPAKQNIEISNAKHIIQNLNTLFIIQQSQISTRMYQLIQELADLQSPKLEERQKGCLIDHVLDQKYLVVQKVYENKYGYVYKAINIQNQVQKRQVFVKQFYINQLLRDKNSRLSTIQKIQLSTSLVDSYVKNEQNLIKINNYPNLLPTYQIYQNSKRSKYPRFFVTQYCNGGTLADLLAANKVLSIQHAIYILYQLSQAITSLHYNNLIHTNLKPQYIYIHNGNYMIGQFWLRSVIDGSYQSNNQIQLCNTMAPEVQSGKFQNNADIYSLGVILCCMICNQKGTLKQRCQFAKNMELTNINFKTKNDQKIPQNLKLFLKYSLEKNPQNRLKSEELLKHPIFNVLNKTQQQHLPCIYYKPISLQQFKVTSDIIAKIGGHQNRFTVYKKTQQYCQINQSEITMYQRQQQQKRNTQYSQTDVGQKKYLLNLRNLQKAKVLEYLEKHKLKQQSLEEKVYEKLSYLHINAKLGEYLYKQFIILLQNKNILNLKHKRNVQLMYMLSKRALMYIQQINKKANKLAHEKFQKEFSIFNERAEKLRRKCLEKFNTYSSQLTKYQSKYVERIKQLYKRFWWKGYKQQQLKKDIIYNGFQKMDYQTSEYVEWLNKTLLNKQNMQEMQKNMGKKTDKNNKQQDKKETMLIFEVYTKFRAFEGIHKNSFKQLRNKQFHTIVNQQIDKIINQKITQSVIQQMMRP